MPKLHHPTGDAVDREPEKGPVAATLRGSGDAEVMLDALRRRQLELENENRSLRGSLRAAEAAKRRYADCYELAPVGYLTLDRGGVIRDLNRTSARWFGEDRTALLGRPLGARFAPEVQGLLSDHLRRVFEAGVATDDALECRPESGSPPRLLRMESRVWPDPDSGDRCLTTLTDVTAHKRTEQALEASERLHRSTLQALPAHIAVLDRDGRISAVNEAWLRFAANNQAAGLPSVAVGADYLEVCRRAAAANDADAAQALAGIEAVRHGSLPGFTMEYPCHSPLEERWFSMNAVPQGSGEQRCVVITHLDITERKRSEAALRHSETRFRQLADAMPQLVWTANADGSVDYFNRRVGDFDGAWRNADGIWNWKPLIHPDDQKHTAAAWEDALASGEAHECAHRLRMGDGSWRWQLTRAVPLRDGSGRVTKWFGTTTDIHRLKSAEEALQESDRRKDEFLATLAHELRNPLAPIRNGVDILKLQGLSDPTSLAAWQMIDRQLKHLVRLVDDLLDVSRINRGKLQLHKERVELGSVVEHALEAARPRMSAAEQKLALSLPAEPLYLDADPVRLAQVVLNLLDNASKYTDKGGRIRLSVAREAAGVVIKVQDTGIGIPPEELPRIFDIFTQGGAVQGHGREGIGIGLSLARGLVEMHGGWIQARSEGPGTGSEFMVHLPAPAPTGKAMPFEKPLEADDEPIRGQRILVVDDEVVIAESLAMVLKLLGNQVETAHDGLAALDAAEHYRPELILLDIGMPKLDGYETCRRMRERPWGRRVRIVALTGWGQEEARRRSAEAGFDAHLVKPVDTATLRRLLAERQDSDD